MGFDGAVLVSKEKLELFIKKWDTTEEQYRKLYIAANKKAKDELSKLTWWQKFWYCSSERTDIRNLLFFKKRYYGTFSTMSEILIMLELIPDDSRWNWLTDNRGEASCIKAMYKAGEPVYLSASQAKVLNYFVELNDIEI